jgi:hypothetical protein
MQLLESKGAYLKRVSGGEEVSLFLNDHEMYELTRRHRRDAQVRMLRSMGIDHKVRGDGSVAVLKTHIDKVFGGITDIPVKRKRTEPNLGAVC